MNRRDFLKRLGFTVAGLPLAGKLFKQEDEVPDIVEIDESDVEIHEDEVPEYTDNPYSMGDSEWIHTVVVYTPDQGYEVYYDGKLVDYGELGRKTFSGLNDIIGDD